MLLREKKKYSNIWSVVRLVLVLSHGQASVERGFSVNEDMLVPNLKKETLIGLRIVYDTVKSLNIKVSEFKITDEMLKYCSSAKSRYNLHILDEKKSQEDENKKRKISAVESEITAARKKLKIFEQQAESCRAEYDKKVQEAFKNSDFNVLAQALALKEKAESMKKKEITENTKVVKELESKLVQHQSK